MLQRRIMKFSTRRTQLVCSIVAKPWSMIFILIDSVIFYKENTNCWGNDSSVCNSSCCQWWNSFWFLHLIIWNLFVLVNICGITTSQLPYRSETNGSSENAVRKVKEGSSAFLVQSCLSKIKIWYQDVSRNNARNSGGGWNGDLIIVDWSHIGNYAASEVHMKKVQLQRGSNLGVCVFLSWWMCLFLNMHVYHRGVCVSLSWSLSLSRLVFVSVSLGVRLGVSCSCVISLSVCVISLIVCVFTLCVCVSFSVFVSIFLDVIFVSLDVGVSSWCWSLSFDCVVSLWYWNFLIWASFLCSTPHSYCASWNTAHFFVLSHTHHNRFHISLWRCQLIVSLRWNNKMRGSRITCDARKNASLSCHMFLVCFSLFSQVLLAHSLHSQHFLQCFFNVSSTFLRIRHWARVSSLC